ncbi:unnamed protein product [Prunus armeniaca]|uniref:Uncharacterized protein n=1 Tax=Prunus armeniaca TaxID=36596 RepID=A0A6J5UNX5_PRUAR|nr:unnamed protein product [Prunus armeniaca]
MSQIVFSDAWWIGTQAENPEEAQLDFPKELTEEFVGFRDNTQNMTLKVVQVEDNVSDDGNKDLMRATPVRHSARTAGKRFKYWPEHFIALTRYCHKRSEAGGIKYTHTKYAK